MLRRFTGKAAAAFSILLIDALHITSPGADQTFPGVARRGGESAVTCRDTRLDAERLVGRGLLPPSVPLILTVLSRLCPVNSWPPIYRFKDSSLSVNCYFSDVYQLCAVLGPFENHHEKRAEGNVERWNG